MECLRKACQHCAQAPPVCNLSRQGIEILSGFVKSGVDPLRGGPAKMLAEPAFVEISENIVELSEAALLVDLPAKAGPA